MILMPADVRHALKAVERLNAASLSWSFPNLPLHWRPGLA